MDIWRNGEAHFNSGQLSSFGDLRTSSITPETGWTFQYNLLPTLVKPNLTNGGTITHDRPFAVIDSGSDPNGFAQIETVRSLRYTPGVGAVARFTSVFSIPQENSIQLIGLGNLVDGWGFGYNGTEFSILRCSDGVKDWIPQSEWNGFTIPNLNFQTGNVFEIKYQWLGFGLQTFSIEHPPTGMLIPVHYIVYANEFIETSVVNPSLPLCATVQNNGNTTPVSLRTPSAMGGVEGISKSGIISINLADDVLNKNILAGVETPVLSFRIPDVWLGIDNYLPAQPLRLSLAADGTKTVAFRAYAGATLTGASWNYINEATAPLQVDKVATNFSGGLKVGGWTLGKTGNDTYELTDSGFYLYAGQSVTITALSVNASEVTVSGTMKQFL